MRKDKRYVASQKSSDILRMYYSGYRDVNKEVKAQNYFFLPRNEAEARRHKGQPQLNTQHAINLYTHRSDHLAFLPLDKMSGFARSQQLALQCAHMRT